MYKIYIKRLNTSRTLCKPYMETVVDTDIGEITDDSTVFVDEYDKNGKINEIWKHHDKLVMEVTHEYRF